MGEIILNQGFRDRMNTETKNIQTIKDFRGPDKTKDTSDAESVCHWTCANMVYFQALLLRVTAQKLKAGAVPKPSG